MLIGECHKTWTPTSYQFTRVVFDGWVLNRSWLSDGISLSHVASKVVRRECRIADDDDGRDNDGGPDDTAYNFRTTGTHVGLLYRISPLNWKAERSCLRRTTVCRIESFQIRLFQRNEAQSCRNTAKVDERS